MRRYLAFGIIGLTLVGVAALWIFIPQLTENTEPTAAVTPPIGSTTVVPAGPDSTLPSSSTTAPFASIDPGGEAVIGVVGEPLSLNPLLTGGNAASVETLSELWTVGLVTLDPNTLDPVPDAVVEVPTPDNGGVVVNEDGTMTLRYELDPDLRWEDGTSVTGLDVAFTHELIVDRALPIRPDLRELHSLIVPGSIDASRSLVTMVLERPTIRYLSLFPVLVPALQIDGTDFARDWDESTWMSAGPFKFEEWEVGRSMRFVRNDQYSAVDGGGNPLPYLDAVQLMFFAGDDALLAAFRLQTVNAAPIAADPDVLAELDSSPSVDLQVAAGPEYEHLAFQFGSGRFIANPGSMNESVEFRKLVARVIDREAVVEEVLAGRVPVLNSVVGMSWPAASAAPWSALTADPDVQAELLLAAVEQVQPASVVVAFAVSASLERTQIAGALLQRLAAMGVSVDVELLELGEYFRDRVLPGEFDIGEWAWRATPGPVGAVGDLEDRFLRLPEADGYNFYRWGAPGSAPSSIAEDLHVRITELDQILDLKELREELEAIDTLLAEQVIIVPMFAVPNAAAVWTSSFSGFEHVATFPDTWNAAYWHRNAG